MLLLSSSWVRSERESVCVCGVRFGPVACCCYCGSSVRGSVRVWGPVRRRGYGRYVEGPVGTWRVRSGTVRFVVVVVVAGTVERESMRVRNPVVVDEFVPLYYLFRLYYPSRLYSLLLLLLVPLYYSFRFNYPSCFCSSFLLLPTLLLIWSTIIGITFILRALVYCDWSSPQNKYSLSPDAFVSIRLSLSCSTVSLFLSLRAVPILFVFFFFSSYDYSYSLSIVIVESTLNLIRTHLFRRADIVIHVSITISSTDPVFYQLQDHVLLISVFGRIWSWFCESYRTSTLIQRNTIRIQRIETK